MPLNSDLLGHCDLRQREVATFKSSTKWPGPSPGMPRPSCPTNVPGGNFESHLLFPGRAPRPPAPPWPFHPGAGAGTSMSGVCLLSTPAMAAFPGHRFTFADPVLAAAAFSQAPKPRLAPELVHGLPEPRQEGGGGATTEDTPSGRGKALDPPHSLSCWFQTPLLC